MTNFQMYCRENRLNPLKVTFEKFKEFYPNLKDKEAHRQFNLEVTELFQDKIRLKNSHE